MLATSPNVSQPAQGMSMLYDSDAFVVVHVPYDDTPGLVGVFNQAAGINTKNGFEIVDKRSNLEVFLTGDWADAMYRQIRAWQATVPTMPEVEEFLDGLCALATLPLVMH